VNKFYQTFSHPTAGFIPEPPSGYWVWLSSFPITYPDGRVMIAHIWEKEEPE
jgi:hypothetical protein